MSNHTPGPWRADLGIGYEPATSLFVRENHASKIVAEVWAPNGGFNARSANARLIAAAPELLEALEKLSLIAEGLIGDNPKPEHSIAILNAHRAILKARGR